MPEPLTISSPHNPLFRHLLKLRENRFRRRQGELLVDGVREISLALQAGLALRRLVLADSDDGEETRELVHAAGDAAVRFVPELLRRIAYGENPRGAVAVFDSPADAGLDQLALPAAPLIVVLVGIEKPGNVGAIFRSADAAGADAVVLCAGGCDRFNPNLIRASLGTCFSMPSATASEAETAAWMRDRGFRCFATIVGAERTFWEADFRGPTAIVLGPEATGLDTSRYGDEGGTVSWVPVSVPMLGTADSLNVSVTAALMLFEARRQRREQ